MYFFDASSSTVYGWGGLIGTNPRPSETRLQKFIAEEGGGSWSTETETESEYKGLSQIRRSHGGVVANTPQSSFYFGGVSEEFRDIKAHTNLPGYFQFDFKSQQKSWVPHDDSPYSTSRTIYGATAHYVPFGPNGLIIIIGGAEYDSGRGRVENLSLEMIWFLDPITHKWYRQVTTGAPPPRRRWHCSVGAVSANNTYEMFVHHDPIPRCCRILLTVFAVSSLGATTLILHLTMTSGS